MNLRSVTFKIISVFLALAVIAASIFLDVQKEYVSSILPSTAQTYSPPNTSSVLDSLTPYLAINSELVGWVSIPSADINTAVTQTENSEFYLTHNLSKSASDSGTAFMDNNCSIYKGTLNTVIYAGTPQNGQAFASLWQYSSSEYLAENSLVRFSTLFEEGEYEIYAVVKGSRLSIGNTVLSLCKEPSEVSKSQFNSYIENVRNIASVNTDSIPKYGDLLLTLCTYDTDENGECIAVLAYMDR